MTMMKGGEVIAEYLVKQKMPFVFGICGHGNVGMLDALHAVRDKVKLDLAASRAVRRPYGGRLFPREASAGRDADLLRAGLGQYRDAARLRADGFVGLSRDHRERSDVAGQPQPVPGNRPRTTRPISSRCCGRWSSAPSSRPASTCCRSRCARPSTRCVRAVPDRSISTCPTTSFRKKPTSKCRRSLRRARRTQRRVARGRRRSALEMIWRAERPVLFIGQGDDAVGSRAEN